MGQSSLLPSASRPACITQCVAEYQLSGDPTDQPIKSQISTVRVEKKMKWSVPRPAIIGVIFWQKVVILAEHTADWASTASQAHYLITWCHHAMWLITKTRVNNFYNTNNTPTGRQQVGSPTGKCMQECKFQNKTKILSSLNIKFMSCPCCYALWIHMYNWYFWTDY